MNIHLYAMIQSTRENYSRILRRLRLESHVSAYGSIELTLFGKDIVISLLIEMAKWLYTQQSQKKMFIWPSLLPKMVSASSSCCLKIVLKIFKIKLQCCNRATPNDEHGENTQVCQAVRSTEKTKRVFQNGVFHDTNYS